MSSKGDQHHDALKPLSWLFGKWRGNDGKGHYPTIQDFTYAEEAEFAPVGMQPNIEYKMTSWDPATKSMMHRESGFIKIKPGSSQIAFVTAHNFGTVDIQEGEVKGQELNVTTQSMARTSFNKEPHVKKATRSMKRTNASLEFVMGMQTDRTQLTEHLRITYQKV